MASSQTAVIPGANSATPPQSVQTRRGRKQNDSLPPSRSRDVQRAFRARRAERLAWLESRVTDLEAENADLKVRLGIVDSSEQPLPSPPLVNGSGSGSSFSRSSPGLAPAVSSPAPLPLPLPALPRPSAPPVSAWLPPSPLYGSEVQTSSPTSSIAVDEGAQAIEHSALAGFINGLTGGRKFSLTDRGGGPIPPEFVTARVAWNILAPLSSSTQTDDIDAPSPEHLGNLIRQLAAAPGQMAGQFVRQDGERTLVSIPAIEHVVASARPQVPQQPLPHPPHLPNFPYGFSQPAPLSLPSMAIGGPSRRASSHVQDLPDIFGQLNGFSGSH